MKSRTLLLTALASIYATLSFAQAGTFDSSFSYDGIKNGFSSGEVYAIAVQPNGKIIAAGKSTLGFTLERYTPSGNLDKNFGSYSVASAFPGSVANSILIKPSGKIFAAGTDGKNFAIAKFNNDGTLDNSFGNNGEVTTNFLGGDDAAYALLAQPDGKIIVAGTAGDARGSDESRIALARYNTDGSLDSSFNYTGKVAKHANANGFDDCHAAILQQDGKIVTVGSSYGTLTKYDYTLARFKPNGKIDSSFGTNGFTATDFGSFDVPTAAATQSDGKIIVTGYTHTGSNYKIVVARYTENGILDNSFGVNGSVIITFGAPYAFSNGVAVQEDDKIVLIARSTPNENNSIIVKLNKDGSRDNTFGENGHVGLYLGFSARANAVALQADNKILLAGKGTGGFLVARIKNDESNLIADNTSSVSIKNIAANIKIFPNPVKDVLHITGIKSQATISIFNAEGKLVKQSTAYQTSEVNIKQLPAGTYYLHVEENVAAGKDKKISNVKFVKE
jgi:uncharacterized delta-60 repeat protein